MNSTINSIASELINTLEINARKDAKFYEGLLLIPEEVNGFYGWATVETPVLATGFYYLDICSTDYIDAYWNVVVNPSESEEFSPEYCPYILGITYCITNPDDITYYRTWKLA